MALKLFHSGERELQTARLIKCIEKRWYLGTHMARALAAAHGGHGLEPALSIVAAIGFVFRKVVDSSSSSRGVKIISLRINRLLEDHL
jgi:hypothetical protein